MYILKQDLPERLLLTYKPEESPTSDEIEPPMDEPNQLPPNVDSASDMDAAPYLANKHLDDGDLLVLPLVEHPYVN